MEYKAADLNWNVDAGKRLDDLAQALPSSPSLEVTVFRFDEESAQGDITVNTRILWRELWKKDIDVRAAIIRPVLESIRRDYEAGDPQLKTRLANLKLPDDPPRN